jgi:putative DNA primase/helicase
MSDFEPTTLEECIDALGYVRDLASVRDDWIKIGNALKSEFGDAAFDAWCDWSSNYPKFKPTEARTVWKSLKTGKNSLGYLFKRAIASGYSRQKREFTAEEKQRFAAERAARMVAIAAQAELDEQEELRWHAEIARVSCEILARTKAIGPSAYLGKKRVSAFGVRFPTEPMLLLIDELKAVLLVGDAVKGGFSTAKVQGCSVRFIKPGDVLVPLRDAAGTVWNIQIINQGGKKLFLKHGRKAGLFHLVGEPPVGASALCVCEGYSTAASIHMARGWPVVVGIDAGNLPPVAVTVRGMFPQAVIIICADDDRDDEANPNDDREAKRNTGLTKATEAAALVGAAVCIPNFKGVQRG